MQAVRERRTRRRGRAGREDKATAASLVSQIKKYFTSRRRHVVIGVTTASPQATGVTHVARAKLPL
jgi:hypothetical protein